MIVTKILGGLGNQLFQYAFGARVAEHTHQPLFLDVTAFKGYQRSYLLDRFEIQAEVLSEEMAATFATYKNPRSWRHWVDRVKPLPYRTYREEPFLQCYRSVPEMLQVKTDSVYYTGYWQNVDYVQPLRERLVHEIVLKPQFQLAKEHPLLVQRGQMETIAVHIRRGDYVTNKSIYPLPSKEYYQEAVQAIAALRPNVQIFVFSNDIEWVKQELVFDLPTIYVSDGHGLTDEQEFDFMRQCDHHVIANSTFSWWAAWLHEGKDQIVFAPKQWLNLPQLDTSGLIPTGWKLL